MNQLNGKGQKHGSWEEMGSYLISNGEYLNGKKNGTWIGYFHNQITYISTYVNNIKNGEYIDYHLNINLNIRSKGQYLNNRKIGLWEYFKLDNVLKDKHFYL